MKLTYRLLIVLMIFSSCSSSNSDDEQLITKATIQLVHSEGLSVANKSIFINVVDDINDYNYQSDKEMGNERSDESGIAIFENIEYPNAFTSENNNTRVFGFLVFYELAGQVVNGQSEIKEINVVFQKGEQKEFVIILD